LMEMPNAICIVGNHEYMAVENLSFLLKEVTDRSLEELDIKTLDNLVTWQYNGAKTTIDEFRELSFEMQEEVIEFLKDFSLYEELNINGIDYLLVHAGLGNFEKGKDILDYSLYDLIWMRADYEKKYFDDKILITGHTPTQIIENNPNPGFIYKKNNHIAIDCGAHIEGGMLAAICLDTLEEFYSSPNMIKEE
ncbi:MAG: metallophosphoesterase, partial [Lachnospiraceae bacterium]|nr:metallophosphoesterase [Lachnospiraceae bacterium]